MALMKCPDCGKEVSDSAPSCPNCGRPNAPAVVPKVHGAGGEGCFLKTMNVGCAIIFGFVALVFVIYAVGKSSNGSTDSGRSDSASAGGRGIANATPRLELVAFSWSRESETYVVSRGQVRNISGESLKNVEAVVTFTDAQGNFITSDDALIEYNPVLPGQISPFSVITTRNPAMAGASVEFKKIFGGVIPSSDVRKR